MNKEYYEDLLLTIDEHKMDLSFLDGRTLLFTGASGLIGRYFIDLLSVYNLSRRTNIKIIALDLNTESLKTVFQRGTSENDPILLAHDIIEPLTVEGPIDYIVHAASPASPYFFANYPVETLAANVIGSLNMLNLAKEKQVTKYLYVSSGEVYGSLDCPEGGYEETMSGTVNSLSSRSAYTEGKRASETLTVSYGEEYGIPTCIARLCYAYGPTYSPKENRVFFQFLNNYLKGEDIVMKSRGEQIRSYSYVGDTVAALLLLLERGARNEAYNVAHALSNCSIKDLAMAFTEQPKKMSLKCEIPDAEEVKGFSPFKHAVQNGSKLEKLGFIPKTDLRDGIRRTVKVKKAMMEDEI